MARYIFKRILQLIPVIIGVSLLVYVLMDLAPGNAIDLMGGDLTTEQLAELYHQYGYDRSVFYRYFQYMLGLLHGDLGYSYTYKMSVWKLYMMRFPATLELAGASVFVSVVLSIPLGIHAAVKHGTLGDNICSVFAMLGLSMPNFWLGLMLMVVFSLNLHWFPSSGASQGLKSLVLPAFTIGTGLMATLMRTTRSSMLDVMRQDYLRTARSKGVSEHTVINRHALRNALIPIITVIGSQMGVCIGGATVTENVYTWPGVGRLLIDAIRQRDVTVVTGCLIMTTTMLSIIMLVIDILYAYADPRLKSQYATPARKRRAAKIPIKRKEVGSNGR